MWSKKWIADSAYALQVISMRCIECPEWGHSCNLIYKTLISQSTSKCDAKVWKIIKNAIIK